MKEWNSLPCSIAVLGLGTGKNGQLEVSLPLLPLPSQQPAVARVLLSQCGGAGSWHCSTCLGWYPDEGSLPLASNFTLYNAAHPTLCLSPCLSVHPMGAGVHRGGGRKKEDPTRLPFTSTASGWEGAGRLSPHSWWVHPAGQFWAPRYSLSLPAQNPMMPWCLDGGGNLAEGQTARGSHPSNCPAFSTVSTPDLPLCSHVWSVTVRL